MGDDMSEYRYTSDGKKVVIVGKLNSKETIVQEIFVFRQCRSAKWREFCS